MNREKEQWRHRIRHYGLFANDKHRVANIAHDHQLLAVPAAEPSCSPSASCAVASAGRAGIELADDAKITFTIALHGKRPWEMLVEDSHRYHSISLGWATDNPHYWEDAIAPVLRRLFVNGQIQTIPNR